MDTTLMRRLYILTRMCYVSLTKYFSAMLLVSILLAVKFAAQLKTLYITDIKYLTTAIHLV
jgi:hypothetical protein